MSNLHNHWGKGPDPEPCDPIPAEMPPGHGAPDTLEAIVARMLHAQKMQESAKGHESFDEANDFELDDPDTLLDFSPYELAETVPEVEGGFQQLDPTPTEPEGAKAPQNSSQPESAGGTDEPPESPAK